MSKVEGFNKLLIENNLGTSFKTLRTLLTEKDEKEFEKEKIVSLEDISPIVKEDLLKITGILQEYIQTSFRDLGVDFYNNTKGGNYFLSSLVALVSNWNLEQGNMRLKKDGKTYYHSWVSMGSVVYDPVLRIITRKDKYYNYFEMEEIYDREEVQSLFKKTATFTYYKKDLEDGSIFPTGYLVLYNTEDAKTTANKVINELEDYEIRISPRKSLYGKKYIFGDVDATLVVKTKAKYMANFISETESISYEEAYRKFINSRLFHDIEKIENGLWVQPYETITKLYLENKAKEKVKK